MFTKEQRSEFAEERKMIKIRKYREEKEGES
jgi:hypothetical protein